MTCFGAGIPSEEVLSHDIQLLHARLEKIKREQHPTKNQLYSRLCNTLQRNQKMLAAVKDGQPWAWMLYPSDDTNILH